MGSSDSNYLNISVFCKLRGIYFNPEGPGSYDSVGDIRRGEGGIPIRFQLLLVMSQSAKTLSKHLTKSLSSKIAPYVCYNADMLINVVLTDPEFLSLSLVIRAHSLLTLREQRH